MKVVAFSGSPRKYGNTQQAIAVVFEEPQKEGITTELVKIGGEALHGCNACYQCFANKDQQCIIKNDNLNSYLAKMIEADGIIFGSPVYFCNVTAEVKALIDRAGLVARANDNLLRRKVGAAVVVVRRAGATFVFSAINFFFFISGDEEDAAALGHGWFPGSVESGSGQPLRGCPPASLMQRSNPRKPPI